MKAAVRRWQDRKDRKYRNALVVRMLSDDRIDMNAPLDPDVLRLLPQERLHRLLDRPNLTPGRAEAIKWELTRRQGQSALTYSRWAILISLAALLVSIIWHD